MASRGRPPVPHPRQHGVYVRFSDTEWGGLEQARRAEHPGPTRGPTLPAWIRDLVVAHAGKVLRVEVTRGALRPLRGRAPEGTRGRLARAVRRAARRRHPARR